MYFSVSYSVIFRTFMRRTAEECACGLPSIFLLRSLCVGEFQFVQMPNPYPPDKEFFNRCKNVLKAIKLRISTSELIKRKCNLASE